MTTTDDPYRYFRVEARDIVEGLGHGLLQLEKEPTPDLVPRLLRLAHTLKGAARVVKQPAIAEEAHAIEEVLASFRDQTTAIARGEVDRILAGIDSISTQVAALEPEQAAKPDAPSQRYVGDPVHMLRPDAAAMDTLLNGISEASVQLRGIGRLVDVVDRAERVADILVDGMASDHDPGAPRGAKNGASPKLRSLAEELRGLIVNLGQTLASGIDQAGREMQQVHDGAERLRLLPAGIAFPSLELTARDAAQSLGKSVLFEAKGGDVRLDGHILGVAQGALIQLVRNAVAHGIEIEAVRARLGKPPMGHVTIEVARRANRVVFACRDDGRGVDLEAVRRVAEQRGLLSPVGQGVEAKELLRTLLRGGLSTSQAVTELSGRGIGLDVVREAADRLGGEVTIDTVFGQGTEMALVVPVSLSALDALLVEAGGVMGAIPLDAVRCAVRLSQGDLSRIEERDTLQYDGQVVPFAPLARALRPGSAPATGVKSAVIVKSATSMVALGIDRLIGAANVVVRPLPSLASADPIVAGAALDPEGIPQLVFDPEELVNAGLSMAGTSPVRATEAKPAILVIDDSLTTRMLEQSILESAGYEVDLAVSGEDALARANARPYRLFLVDVEMPGMDGFTFVETARADPNLRAVPAIMVTSRDSSQDRERGAAVGAHAYIVKGEFDQGGFLDTIRDLVR